MLWQRWQAVADTQIALALGATLSDTAADVLKEQSLPALTFQPTSRLSLISRRVKRDR